MTGPGKRVVHREHSNHAGGKLSAVGGASQTLTLNGMGHAASGFRSILFTRTDDFGFVTDDGRLTTRQYRLDSSGLRIGRVISTGHRVALSEDANATILMPRFGGLNISIARQVHELPAGRVALMPPQTRSTEAKAEGTGDFVGDIVMLPQAALNHIAHEIGASLPQGAFNRLDRAAAARLSIYLSSMLNELGRLEPVLSKVVLGNMATLMRDLIADVMAGSDEDDEVWMHSGLERERVRRAEEMIRGRAHENLSIASLARDLGIGLRSLQLAFKRAYGKSPREYQARVRLDHVRMRLLTADPARESVTEIALDCGFTHLGRFACVYAQAFGEKPSETLRRPRGS